MNKKVIKLSTFLETNTIEDLCPKALLKSEIGGSIVSFKKEVKRIEPTIWRDGTVYRIHFVDNDTALFQIDWLYVEIGSGKPNKNIIP